MRSILAAVGLWLVLVVTGFGVLTKYASTAGDAGRAAETWPAESRFDRDRERPTLVLFLHPQCPCSRATIEELDRLLAESQGRLGVRVVFVRPSGMPAGWEHTDLWRRAAAIPGVSVAADVGGVEARQFGARTSGQALLYEPDGRLLFRGGLTAARGHAGDSPGGDALRAILAGNASAIEDIPVFGCPLFE
jgi:hypothetical protein